MNERLATLDRRIRHTYEQLRKTTDLSPSPDINLLFTSLVADVTRTLDEQRTLSDREVSELQKICSRGEYELERYWAERIISSRNPKRELSRFPYAKNYFDLTRLEWLSFQGCQTHKDHRVLFIGGGPLPMTAIMLAREFGISVTVIDNDAVAADLARNVIQKLGLAPMIAALCTDARRFTSYAMFSVIFIAALAGLLPDEKQQIFRRIKQKTKKNTHLIARSSWGNRKLLYRPLSPKTMRDFQPVLRIDPYSDIVNSVVILKKT